MLFSLFSKLCKTSADGCFLVFVLQLSYIYGYETQITKRLYNLTAKKSV